MIDPSTLARQRLGPRQEYACPRCCRRTTDRAGLCAACKRCSIPDLTKLQTEHVLGVILACKAELKRRREEIDSALGEP